MNQTPSTTPESSSASAGVAAVTTDPASASAATEHRPLWLMKFADIKELSKPRITLMVLITTFIGFVMADRAVQASPGLYSTLRHEYVLLFWTLLGTALSCMGASVLNQTYERDTDSLMHRTQKRPLPAGRVHLLPATLMGLVFSILGVGLLAIFVNTLTAVISAFTIFSYVLIYTPMKRMSSLSTIVGAVPGALPPVMGYTAIADRIENPAILLFGIMFLWQLPHFLAIAWLHREDYARASMPMLPVLDPDGSSTFRQMLISCVVLVPLGMLPTFFGVSGWIYFTGSLIAGLVFLAYGVALVRGRTRSHARAMFFASLMYLPVVLGLMMLDQR